MIELVRFDVIDAIGKDVGLSEVGVFTASEQSDVPADWLDPYIKMHRSRYFHFINGYVLFMEINVAPLTCNKNQFGGEYNYNEMDILVFEQIYNWMLGGPEFMHAAEGIDFRMSQDSPKSEFNYADEIVRPGCEKVLLRDNNIWNEFTSIERISFYNLRFIKTMDAEIIVNLWNYSENNVMTDAKVKKVCVAEMERSFSQVDCCWVDSKDVKMFCSTS